jgi:hypothetical protein
MKKFISAMMVVAMLVVSATSALADGRGHRGGRGGSSGGVSSGTAALFGIGMFGLGAWIGGFNAQQQAPTQYAPIAPPAYYPYQPNPYQQVQIPPEYHFIGECLPYGADFPGGVNVPGRGYLPPGMATPGFCF